MFDSRSILLKLRKIRTITYQFSPGHPGCEGVVAAHRLFLRGNCDGSSAVTVHHVRDHHRAAERHPRRFLPLVHHLRQHFLLVAGLKRARNDVLRENNRHNDVATYSGVAAAVVGRRHRSHLRHRWLFPRLIYDISIELMIKDFTNICYIQFKMIFSITL